MINLKFDNELSRKKPGFFVPHLPKKCCISILSERGYEGAIARGF